MPNADFDSWTHPDVIAAEMVRCNIMVVLLRLLSQCKWAEDEDRPSSGSLVQIHTHEGKTVPTWTSLCLLGTHDVFSHVVRVQEFVHT